MHHIYALFDRIEDASDAYEEILAGGCASEHCSAILHEERVDLTRLPSGERAASEGAAEGAAAGGVVGAIAGGLVALGGGLAGLGPLAAAALGGGLLAGYGALAGGIGRSDEPERHLRALQDQVEHGKILIAVETDDPQLRAMCEAVFADRGGSQIVF